MADATLNTIDGTVDNDLLVGTSGEDLISGGFGLDTIFGGAGNDTISGGSNYPETSSDIFVTLDIDDNGEVIIAPGQAVEMLDGGVGVDIVKLSGGQSSYTLLLSPGGTTLVDRRPDGEGIDKLAHVELIDFDSEVSVFNNDPMDLTVFGRSPGVGADDIESIIELYIAYFDRAPDAIGLSFWTTAFANGTSLSEMASLFVQQPETIAAFPDDMTSGAVVDLIYQNVLGRDVDDEGREFWIDMLDSGGVAPDQFILEVIGGAQADPYDGATQGFIDQQLSDRYYLSNKTDIGAYFAVHRGMSNVDSAIAAMDFFDGTQASIWDAVGAIDNFYASALDPFDGEFIMPLVGVLETPFDIG